MSRELTLKQKQFCNQYAKHGNGTLAVQEANYDVKDDNSASSIACENLRKLDVKQEIERIKEENNIYIQNSSRMHLENLNNIAVQKKNLIAARQASDSMLDRAGYMPVQKREQLTVSISISPTEYNRLKEALKRESITDINNETKQSNEIKEQNV